MKQALLASLALLLAPPVLGDRPVDIHGAIEVADGQVVDQTGAALSIAGPSLFWGNRDWGSGAAFPPDSYYNRDVIRWFKQHWNAPIIRIAMGVENDGGILEDPHGRWQKIAAVADAAIAEGMYFVVDWHSHHAEDNTTAAVRHFRKVATQWGQTPNLIYEIYNEPLDTTDWASTIKPYAETVIAAIREIDPDNLIIVGTQSWSQDVDKAADNRIDGWTNIAYSLHFYAGTHKQALRDKAKYAIDAGLPLVVTEWGTVSADGDGDVDEQSTQEWMDFIRDNELTHLNWSAHSKAEAASILRPGTPPDGSWTREDLSESGRLVGKIISSWHRHCYAGTSH